MGLNLPLAFLDFQSIYDFVNSFMPSGLDWIAYVITAVFLAFLVINAMVMSTALYTWFERRAIGRFQSRLGPNRWGPFGLLQPIADLLKLITKEDTIPDTADKKVFAAAPVVFLVTTLIIVSVVPFGNNSFLGKLNVGLLFVFGVTSANTIAIFMGGWASRNKYAMLGSMRAVSMLIAYEVPMALSIVGVILMSGSLALFDVVASQDVPFLIVQPLGFLVFVAAASAEMSRTPFDQIEAESELGSGYHTEYSGMKFALFQLGEFMAPLITSIMVTVLFLAGTRGFSPIPGQIWFVLKVFIVLFALLWVRATWPRLRIDQIMSFAWKALLGLAFVNFFLIAVEVLVFADPATGKVPVGSVWIMSAINWIVTIGAIVIIANLVGQRKLIVQKPVASPLANMYAEGD